MITFFTNFNATFRNYEQLTSFYCVFCLRNNIIHYHTTNVVFCSKKQLYIFPTTIPIYSQGEPCIVFLLHIVFIMCVTSRTFVLFVARNSRTSSLVFVEIWLEARTYRTTEHKLELSTAKHRPSLECSKAAGADWAVPNQHHTRSKIPPALIALIIELKIILGHPLLGWLHIRGAAAS